MEVKKEVSILIILAIILAVTAITVSVSDSNILTTAKVVSNSPNGGIIGIDIKSTPVEDRLAKINGGV